MPETTVDERMTALERRLESLQQQVNERLFRTPLREKQGWPAIVGTFANDPFYEEAMRLGREWRESQFQDSPEETA